MIKYLKKLKKRSTDTNLISTEYVVLDENNNLIGTFQNLKEAQIQTASKNNCCIYKFVTYKVTTSQKL